MTITKRIALALPVLGVAVLWFLLLGPSFVGGPASYILVSGDSMEPTLSGGDLTVLRQQDRYREGDIVAFTVPEGQPGEGAVVIHRIVGGSVDEGFIMQGDNKERPDLWRPGPEDIIGKRWLHLPGVGRFVYLLRQPLILGSLVGGLGMLTVLSGGSGKPAARSRTSRSRPAGAARGGPLGTRLILGLVLAGALTRAVGLLRKRDRGTPG